MMSEDTNTVEWLVSDEKFQKWVLSGKRGTFVVGDAVKSRRLDTMIDEAAAIVLAMNPSNLEIDQEKLNSNWDQILKNFDLPENKFETIEARPVSSFMRGKSYYKYVAAMAMIGLTVVLFMIQNLQEKPLLTYQTDIYEKKTVLLADGTKVRLNGNSELIVWNQEDQSPREVWLKGEAFFHVKKSNEPHKNFVVHSGCLDIEVLGTEFNVLNDNLGVHVALKSGKVKLTDTKDNYHDAVFMVPGEVYSFVPGSGDLTLNTKKSSQYLAWLDGKIILDNSGIDEIGALISARFGLDVMVSASVSKGKKINNWIIFKICNNLFISIII